jgi:hypothetical protein
MLTQELFFWLPQLKKFEALQNSIDGQHQFIIVCNLLHESPEGYDNLQHLNGKVRVNCYNFKL